MAMSISQMVRQCNETADRIEEQDVSTWEGWIVYILELLDDKLVPEAFEHLLGFLKDDIVQRLEGKEW